MIKYETKINEQLVKVVGVFKDEKSTYLDSVYNDYIQHKELTKFNTLTPIHHVELPMFVIGLGKKEELTLQKLQEVFGTIAKQVKEDCTVVLESFLNTSLTIEQVAYFAAEVITLATYEYVGYKTKKDSKKETNFVLVSTQKDVSNEVMKGIILGTSTNKARELVNTPPNFLTAVDLAKFAATLAEDYMLESLILDKQGIEELKMGGLLGVNKGSISEPRFIVLKYMGNKESDELVALVGKGLTYDTGGYSLKPREGMVGMKGDMGGAATVLGVIDAVAKLKLKVNVMVVIPSTDNVVSANAIVPDDVLVSMSGKTIEVNNTDAEGRLILCDGITYAVKNNATKIFDVATLTGGVLVALGTTTTGVMSNNQEFTNEFLKIQEETFEGMWQLPITEEVKKAVKKSDVADLINSGGRFGHSIFAAAFLNEFTEDVPWIHLDIAGTSEQSSPSSIGPKGATGAMVRTLTKYLETISK